MRVKVRVDVRKPLKIEKKIAVNGCEGSVVKFKYEKLGLFCFVCGILGHSEDKCDVRYAMERDDGRRIWSNEIRAEVRRPGGRMDSRWLREEGRGRADTFAGSQSRGNATNSSHSSQSNSERPSAHATERESEPGVNSVVLHVHNDIISTPSMVANRRNSVVPTEPVVIRTIDTSLLAPSSSSPLRESRQDTPLLTEVAHSEQMEIHIEKKRRRAE
ncbi:cysteine desulfurase mitochondrial-like, partial [Trifolium pratense]